MEREGVARFVSTHTKPTFHAPLGRATGKKTPGGAGTHTDGTHTGDGTHGRSGAHGHTDHTDRRTSQPSKPNDTPFTRTTQLARPCDRRPKPRPTQQLQARYRYTGTDSTGKNFTGNFTGTVPVPVKSHRGEPGHTRDITRRWTPSLTGVTPRRTSQPSRPILVPTNPHTRDHRRARRATPRRAPELQLGS